MKLTIDGSDLASRLKPLTAYVRQHEGIDYDLLYLAIRENGGKKYLNGLVDQPTYSTSIHLNLSGQGDSAEDSETIGADPIDALAEACDKDVAYCLNESDMRNINRNVGTSTGIYSFENLSDVFVTLKDGTRLHKFCNLPLNHALYVPRHLFSIDTDEYLEEERLYARGWFDALELSKALDSAIRFCRLARNKGGLKAQAIHLAIDDVKMSVEGISLGGAVRHNVEHTPVDGDDSELKQGMHLAISLPAALVLKQICDKSGSTIYWSLDKDSSSIYFSCDEYTHRCTTEEVKECTIEEFGSQHNTLTISREDLLHAVRRVKVIGNDITFIYLNKDEEFITVKSGLSDSVSVISVSKKGSQAVPIALKLPTEVLLAAVMAYNSDNICVNYSADKDFLSFDSPEDVYCVVHKL